MRTATFDGVRVYEITADFKSAAGTLGVKAGFVNTKTGQTHGWTSTARWSAETIQKLSELRVSMQLDLEQFHFEGGAEQVPTTRGGGIQEAFNGLGEQLSQGSEPPQV